MFKNYLEILCLFLLFVFITYKIKYEFILQKLTRLKAIT